MQTLRDHLCADQDVNFAGAKIPEDTAVIVLALHRVRIHALMRACGKQFAAGLLNLLRAGAGKTDRGIPAFRVRANARGRLHMTANVAGEPLFDAMIGQRDAAIRTPRHIAACRHWSAVECRGGSKTESSAPGVPAAGDGFLELW